MSDDEIIIPKHYKVLADALKPLIREIQNAFVNRPVPQGIPYETLPDALQPIFDNAPEIIQKLSDIMNAVPGCLALKEDNVSEDAVIDAVSNVEKEIRRIIGFFHHLWERPFPPDLAGGQPLASAIMEDVLRGCLDIFEKLVDIVERPEEILNKYGSYTIQLKLVLDGQAANRFNQWINERKNAIYFQKTLTCRDNSKTKNFLLGALLGWWFGHNDK